MIKNISATELAIYSLKNVEGKHIKDFVLGYIAKEKDSLRYYESNDISDPALKARYISIIRQVVEELIRSDSISFAWGKRAEKDGKIIYHEYRRTCSVDDPNFLLALHDAFIINAEEIEKLLGLKISVIITR